MRVYARIMNETGVSSSQGVFGLMSRLRIFLANSQTFSLENGGSNERSLKSKTPTTALQKISSADVNNSNKFTQHQLMN